MDWQANCPHCGKKTKVDITEQIMDRAADGKHLESCDLCHKLFDYSVRIEINTRKEKSED